MKLGGRSYLIGGGAGFIGIHLSKSLIEQGASVTIVDDFSAAALSLSDLVALLPTARIIQENLATYEHTGNLNVIFHLASAVGPVGVMSHAAKIGADTLATTLSTIEIAKRYAARLVYVSTSEVYGTSGVHAEENKCVFFSPFSARQEYALAKRLAETIIQNSLTYSNKPFSYQIVRPFNVTGPFQDPKKGFVAPRFVLQALNDLPLTIYGSGDQIRAFSHISDICDGLIEIAHSKAHNEVWNIGNSLNTIPIIDLAKKIITTVGKGSIIHLDPQTIHGAGFHEANDKIPNASKALSRLNWHPQHDANFVISSVVDYWKKNNLFRIHKHWLEEELAPISFASRRMGALA